MAGENPSGENIPAKMQALVKPFIRTFLWVVPSGVLFVIVYRHFVDQAFGQQFVLVELRPIMDAAIDFGGRIYWFAEKPSLVPTVLALLLVLVAFLLHLSRPGHGKPTVTNRWLIVAAATYSMTFLLAGTSNFWLKMLGVSAVLGLAWYMQDRDSVEREMHPWDNRTCRMILAGIVLFGLILRLYQLDSFPLRYSVDEQLLADAALELNAEKTGFFDQYQYIETYLVKIVAIRTVFSALGVGLFQHRTVAAIEGAIGILLIYILCRRLGGNRVGIFAAIFLAVDPWHVGYSKLGLQEIEGPVFLILLLLLLGPAIREGGKWRFGILGAVAGATLYLYLSCFVMAPFAFAAAAVGRWCVIKEGKKSILLWEMSAMVATFALVLVPHLTFGRESLLELLSFYTTTNNVIQDATSTGISPVTKVFAKLCQSIETFFHLAPIPSHPSYTFYANPVAGGLVVLGLGILLGSGRKLENLLLLSWIPVAFLPASMGYGFKLTRLLVLITPISAILAGLSLSKLWGNSDEKGIYKLDGMPSRLLVVLLLAIITLTGLHIVYKDTVMGLGRERHPQKAAEFINSLPESCTVLISSRIKDFPFILYLINYEKIQQADDGVYYHIADFAEIQALFNNIPSKTNIAIVTDPGRKEELFFEKLKAANPGATITKKTEYWACVLANDDR